MKQVYSQTIKSFANALNINDENGMARLIGRCGFDEKGYLVRLNLNGFGIKGNIDISEFTKHLTVLDIRNNPGLGEISISPYSSLAFARKHEEIDCNTEVYRLDEGQHISIATPGHDIDESPFSRYFGAGRPEAEKTGNELNDSEIKGLEEVVRELTDNVIETDLEAYRAELATEQALLRIAMIGRELTTRLQANLDRTNIGLRGRGLDQLQELALQFEKVGFINRMIGEINGKITEEATEESIRNICKKKADGFWNAKMDGVTLGDHLVENVDKVTVNAYNYGKDGVAFIKSAGAGDTENYLKARRIARDDHIANAAYGSSTLRLKVKKFNTLADELRRSIANINENIRLFEDEARSRHGQA
ncbi:MAG: hypothetical protein K6E85_17295 [Lachnospiraceae bacterium]|nr:hypothetical protein [Lachnospiraceae bacterium]